MSDALAVLDVRQSFEVLAISLGLGGLVGLQRQQAESRIAGIRTFPLITVLGTISGLVTTYNVTLGVSLMVVSMMGVIAASGLGNYIRALHSGAAGGRRGAVSGGARPAGEKPEKPGAGITTEMAILVMYAVGVYLVFGPAVISIAITGVVVLLLYAKQLLHRFVRSLGQEDVHGIMQFVLLACVILPILPDRTFGYLGVLNPRQIWLVVVLVVGISLGGYIMYRFVGERAGTIVSGLLGGMISSTATTASFARRTHDGNGALAASALLAIMLASVVVYGRVFVELSAVAAAYLPQMIGPIAAMWAVTSLLALTLLMSRRPDDGGIPPQQNPTNIKAALIFAAIYAGVVLASAAAREHLGAQGFYFVAAISGLSDMDAITLSSGRSVVDGRLSPDEARRAVVIALMSSMVMKVFICGTLGNRKLFARAALLFAINILAGILIVMLWPRSAGA
jgi:uncharacterized membrane protein (DUF4010 family)